MCDEEDSLSLLPSSYFDLTSPHHTHHSHLFDAHAHVWTSLSRLPSYLSSLISSVGTPSGSFPNLEIWTNSDYPARVHPSVVVESPELVAIGKNVKIGPCVLIQGGQSALVSLSHFSLS